MQTPRRREIDLPILRERPLAGTAFSIAAVAVATAVRYALDHVLPPGFPFLTFLPAVVASCFVGGSAPGVLASLLSAGVAWYAFMPPQGAFATDGPTLLALGLFLFVCLANAALVHVTASAVTRLRGEQAVSRELADTRETLLRELQHRISNSLQLVSGLMRMQRSRVADPAARKVLEDASARLVLIGRLQRHLNDPLGRSIRFDVFLGTLCHDLADASPNPDTSCVVRAEPLPLGPDRTVPLALIASELVTNALSHGAPAVGAGTVTVLLETQADGWMALTVSDDGAGLPEGFDATSPGYLGLRVSHALASQVRGRLDLFNRGGTVARLTFPP